MKGHECLPHFSGLPHLESQVGIGSSQCLRGLVSSSRAVRPQGQVFKELGKNGHAFSPLIVGGLMQDSMNECLRHE